MPTLTVLAAAVVLAFGACSQAQNSPATAEADAGDATPAQTAPLTTAAPDESLPVAYFAGGCFWCTEASFERIRGVQAVVSGYSGGPETDPTYKQVASGQTGHAEAIAIYYDSSVVDFPTLLDVFYVAHDGTQLNRQGPDVGPQYRSAIFYRNEAERVLAEAAIAELEADGYGDIVTELAPFARFYPAEDYHQGYYELNPRQSYVYNVSRPKVEKVEKRFAELLKEPYR